jgi:hypothetical protein
LVELLHISGDDKGIEMRAMFLFLISICLAAVSSAAADEAVLHEGGTRMDKGDILDRVALVVTAKGPVTFGAGARHAYKLAEGEQADLLIFLNYGDGPLDITKPPTVRKPALISQLGLSWVLPLSSTLEGAVNIESNSGFDNTYRTTHTLRIAFDDGTFKVTKWSTASENNRNSQRSLCWVDYIAGKAFKRQNREKKVSLNGIFKQPTLAEWSGVISPKVCDQ